MERRRDPIRRRTLKGARISFNAGTSVFSCVVRNLTDIGARLEMESTLGVPNAFTLLFDDGSPRRDCAVKWRSNRIIGVEFQG